MKLIFHNFIIMFIPTFSSKTKVKRHPLVKKDKVFLTPATYISDFLIKINIPKIVPREPKHPYYRNKDIECNLYQKNSLYNHIFF